MVLTGIKAAPGAGVGVAVLPSPAAELESVPDRGIEDPETEEAVFRQAVAAVQLELRTSGERMAAQGTDGGARDVPGLCGAAR